MFRRQHPECHPWGEGDPLWWKASGMSGQLFWGTLVVCDTWSMAGACHTSVAVPLVPLQKEWMPVGPWECPSTFHRGEIYTWASSVREDVAMIKSTVPLGRICFLWVFSLIWLKTQPVAKQKLVCRGGCTAPLCLDCSYTAEIFHPHIPKNSPPLFPVRSANLASPNHLLLLQMAGWDINP